MSNFEEQALVEPGTGFFKVKASERVLFLPAGPFARILSARFFAKKIRARPYPARMYRLKQKGFEIDLVGPAMGAPVAGMVIEMLIAGGAKKIIALGFAGSLDPSLKIGDLLLVKEAISDEGTGPSYIPGLKSVSASESLVSAIISELSSQGEKIQAGKVVSTDAFFRETREKLERFRSMGALAVEMEMSALYAIGKFRGVEVLGMVIISDELFRDRWVSGFKSPTMLLNFIKAGSLALKVLSK